METVNAIKYLETLFGDKITVSEDERKRLNDISTAASRRAVIGKGEPDSGLTVKLDNLDLQSSVIEENKSPSSGVNKKPSVKHLKRLLKLLPENFYGDMDSITQEIATV